MLQNQVFFNFDPVSVPRDKIAESHKVPEPLGYSISKAIPSLCLVIPSPNSRLSKLRQELLYRRYRRRQGKTQQLENPSYKIGKGHLRAAGKTQASYLVAFRDPDTAGIASNHHGSSCNLVLKGGCPASAKVNLNRHIDGSDPTLGNSRSTSRFPNLCPGSRSGVPQPGGVFYYSNGTT